MGTEKMMNRFTLQTPLQSFFSAKEMSFGKQSLLILAGVLLLALASQLSIPLKPVPLTLQSATVILIGMAYGAKRGALVVLTYLIAGCCGAPVFANFSFGIASLFGTTGGYLLGFVPAAFLSGYLAENGFGKHFVSSLLAACLGAMVIFFFGVCGLSLFVGWHNAIIFGFMPFIMTETIKLIALSAIIPSLWSKKS